MAKASLASLRVTAAAGLALLALAASLESHVASSASVRTTDAWGVFTIVSPSSFFDGLRAKRPAISGSRVAYVTQFFDQTWSFIAVVHDVLTNEVRHIDELGNVSGDVLLEGDWFVAERGGDAPGLYLLNLATGEQRVLPDTGGAYEMPALDNGRLVWVRVDGCCSSDLLLYEFATGDITLVTDDGGDSYEYEPDISGDWVVWFTGTSGYFDVRAKNLLTGELLWITDEEGNQGIPQIEYPYIVWSDTRIVDIYGYNLETRERFPVAVGPEPATYPVIGGRTAFYECGYDWDLLCAHELDGGAEEVIYTCPAENPYCLNFDLGSESLVTAAEDLVVWLYDKGGAIGLLGARRLTQQTFLPLARR